MLIRLIKPSFRLLRDHEHYAREWKHTFGNLDLTWVRNKMARQESFMVLERYLGLTHPQRPFAVSATAVVLEDADDIAEVHGIAEQMGHDFDKSCFMSVPLSFPPALSDCDKNLQHVMCCLALGNSESSPDAVLEATQAFAQELLGESAEELAKLDEEELATILDGASSLVKQALAALHQAELERVRSETVARFIVDTLVTDAWFQIRCRQEWKQVEARVEKWAKERKCLSKKTKRKDKLHGMASDVVPRKTSVQAAVKELHARTTCYTKTAQGLASLVASGIVRAVPLQPEPDQGDVHLPELIVEILPPRAARSSSAALVDAQPGAKLNNHRKQHFLQLLEASAIEDYDLAMARREEAELQLTLQLSLHDKVGDEHSIRGVKDAAATSSNNPAGSQHVNVDFTSMPSEPASLRDDLSSRVGASEDTDNTLAIPPTSKIKPGRSRASSAPPLLHGEHSPATPPLLSSSSGGPTSSGEPTASSDSVVICPKHPVAHSTICTLLKDGLLPSFGTVDHSSALKKTCFVCRAFQRDGECRDGRACRRCHAPHSVDSQQCGHGRTRQRAVRMKAELRRCHSPDRFFWV